MVAIISFFTLFILSVTWFLYQLRHTRLLNMVIKEYYTSEYKASLDKFAGTNQDKKIGIQELNKDVMALTQNIMKISNKIDSFRKMSYKELEKEWQNIQDIKEMFS